MPAPQPFDPTYGYSLEQLLKVDASQGPSDFAAFWQSTYTEALHTLLEITRRPINSPTPWLKIYEIEFNSLDGVRIGGWLTVPADGKFARGVVVGHGYGGRTAPDLGLPGPAAVAIFPCARGFDRSAQRGIPNNSNEHVLCGIENRETYVHRGCAADVWCAASALLESFPEVASTLHYMGGSFGGGIGALAMPWDARFQRAYLDVPSFGNHPLRVTLPCQGSGEQVRKYYLKHPEVMQTIAYFDAATAARHIDIPTYVSPAVSDPAVPPPGQFAVYNAITAPKKLFVRATGHPCQEKDDREISLQLASWFASE